MMKTKAFSGVKKTLLVATTLFVFASPLVGAAREKPAPLQIQNHKIGRMAGLTVSDKAGDLGKMIFIQESEKRRDTVRHVLPSEKKPATAGTSDENRKEDGQLKRAVSEAHEERNQRNKMGFVVFSAVIALFWGLMALGIKWHGEHIVRDWRQD